MEVLLGTARRRWSTTVLDSDEHAFRRCAEDVLDPAWRRQRDRLCDVLAPGFSPDQSLSEYLDALLRSYVRQLVSVAARRASKRAWTLGFPITAQTWETLALDEFFEVTATGRTGGELQVVLPRFELLPTILDWAREELLYLISSMEVSQFSPVSPPTPAEPTDLDDPVLLLSGA